MPYRTCAIQDPEPPSQSFIESIRVNPTKSE